MEPPGTSASPSTPTFSCLVIDDDAGFTEMVHRLILEAGGTVQSAGTVAAGRQAVQQRAFDLVLLDNRLPDGTGFELYPWLARQCPASLVVMITGVPELGQAVELTRNGLFDYLSKPLRIEALEAVLQRMRRRQAAPGPDEVLDQLHGESAAMREVTQALRQAARHAAAAVLITGETGTGKDLAARVLHGWTYADRSPAPPFVALNCPAVPADMFEAELFGSEKGAYTGADRRRTGLVEAAEGGTLFLDEVSEIPLALQAKLLRFLESREYRPLGSPSHRVFAGRVVAATNRSLRTEVAQGRFREDLLFRLDVFGIHLPPLRDRLDDLPRLAELLMEQLCRKYGRRRLHLRAAELESLRGYRFPGNVRELRNLLERSLLKTPDEEAWLAMDLAWLTRGSGVTEPGPTPLRAALVESPSPVAAAADRELTPIEQQEYQLIARVMKEERGGIRRAAGRLGLTHQALLRRLQKWPELRQV